MALSEVRGVSLGYCIWDNGASVGRCWMLAFGSCIRDVGIGMGVGVSGLGVSGCGYCTVTGNVLCLSGRHGGE